MRVPLFQVLPYSCAWLLAAGIALHAIALQAATPSMSTTWLDNGLRLVSIEVPNTDIVSIRLLVDDGTLRVPRRDQHIPHLVEHLSFRTIAPSPKLDNWFVQQGLWSDAWTSDFTVGYSFDAPERLGGKILEEIRRQWETPFFESNVRLEAERVRHEMVAHRSDSPLMILAQAEAPNWEHLRERLDDVDRLDRVSPDTLWAHFNRTYVGNRLTLIVAGSSQAHRDIAPTIKSLSEIPAGASAPGSRYGSVSWLAGHIGNSDPLRRNFFGYRLGLTPRLDPIMRDHLQQAGSMYLRDRLALESPVAYDFSLTAYSSVDAEMWVFEGYTDFFLDTRSEVHESAEAAFAWLASDSALSWWQSFVEREKNTWPLWTADPSTVSDVVFNAAALTPHRESIPKACILPPADPTTLHVAYRNAFERGAFFKLGNVSFSSWDREDLVEEFEAESLLLVPLTWLVAEWASERPVQFHVVVISIFVLIILLLLRPPRLDQAAPTLRMQRAARNE